MENLVAHEQVLKVLIAIPTCFNLDYGRWESAESPHYDSKNEAYGANIHISGSNDRSGAVRDTWWKDLERYKNVTGKFFYGIPHRRSPRADEVFLHVLDDYAHVVHKTIAICKYALAEGYDYLLKADDDTFIYTDRLVEELWQHRPDYGGREHRGVCIGGSGYWLSKRAMTAVKGEPDHWAEDLWVGNCMKMAGIKAVMLDTHQSGYAAHWADINNISPRAVTLHAVRPGDMRVLYAKLSRDRAVGFASEVSPAG